MFTSSRLTFSRSLVLFVEIPCSSNSLPTPSFSFFLFFFLYFFLSFVSLISCCADPPHLRRRWQHCAHDFGHIGRIWCKLQYSDQRKYKLIIFVSYIYIPSPSPSPFHYSRDKLNFAWEIIMQTPDPFFFLLFSVAFHPCTWLHARARRSASDYSCMVPALLPLL